MSMYGWIFYIGDWLFYAVKEQGQFSWKIRVYF